jgi:hypothetical protein
MSTIVKQSSIYTCTQTTQKKSRVASLLLKFHHTEFTETTKSLIHKKTPENSTSLLPKYLHKTFQQNVDTKQTWSTAKQETSQNAAWKGILIREELLEHKINLASKNIAMRSLAYLPMRMSKVNRLNAQIRNESTHVFEPLMDFWGKMHTRSGEALRGMSQCIDSSFRNGISAFFVLTGNKEVDIEPLLSIDVDQPTKLFILQIMSTAMDTPGQIWGDVFQGMTKGQDIIKPKHMFIQNSGTSSAAQMKSRLHSIIALSQHLMRCVERAHIEIPELNKQLQLIDIDRTLSAQQKIIQIQAIQEKIQKIHTPIEQALGKIVDATYEMQEAIFRAKGDTAHRKLKIKEKICTGIARGICIATIDPFSDLISAATNGIVPRGDLLVRNLLIQPFTLSIDFILSYRFIRACHIKDPEALLTEDALNINLDKNLGNMNKYERTRIILEYIAQSKQPKCIALRNKFKNLPWQDIANFSLRKKKDNNTYNAQLHNLSNTLSTQGQHANACMREFTISPLQIQKCISHFPQAKIERILSNVKEQLAKLKREKTRLYLQKKHIDKDILDKKSNNQCSIYANSDIAKKNHVKSQQQIDDEIHAKQQEIEALELDIVDFNRTCMYYDYVAKLTPEEIKVHQNIDAALQAKYPNIINPDWKYSIENIYQRSINLKYKSPMLNHLRSYTRLVMRSTINDMMSPGLFREKALFRDNQFQIFATSVFQEADKVTADLHNDAHNINHEEKTFHNWMIKELVSICVIGVLCPTQIGVAMITLQESIRRYGRTRHHDFYLNTFIKMAEFASNQNINDQSQNLENIHIANKAVQKYAHRIKYYVSSNPNITNAYQTYCIIINKMKHKQNLNAEEMALFEEMYDLNEKYVQAKQKQLKLITYNKGYTFIEEELSKQKKALQLLMGNAEPFIELINQGIHNEKSKDVVHLEMANQLYSMAAGLIEPREKFYQRTNIAGVHKDAIEITTKINHKINVSETKAEINRRWDTLYAKINKKYAKKRKEIQQQKSLELMLEFLAENTQNKKNAEKYIANTNISHDLDDLANNVGENKKQIDKTKQQHVMQQFNAFGIADGLIQNKTIAQVNSEKIQLPKHLSDVCKIIYQEIQNKPKHLRAGDQGIFFGLIYTLRENIACEIKKIQNDLSKNLIIKDEKNKITSCINAYQNIIDDLNVFLMRSEKEIDGVMLPKIQLNLGDDKFAGETYNIDFSNTRHHTHHIERDVYENIEANLSTKKFTIGKATNYSKRILKPVALAIVEIPKHILQIPLYMLKSCTNYALSKQQTKKTRAQFEYTKQVINQLFESDNYLTQNKLSKNLHKKESTQEQIQFTYVQNDEQALQKKAKLNGLNIFNFAPRHNKQVYALQAQVKHTIAKPV